MVDVGSKWIKVADIEDLSPGERTVIKIGKTDVLLVNHEGTVYAVRNNCPHMSFPLKSGKISDEGCIECPLHHATFDLETGTVQRWSNWPIGVGDFLGGLIPPSPLQTYIVRQEGNSVFLELR